MVMTRKVFLHVIQLRAGVISKERYTDKLTVKVNAVGK